MAQHKLKSELCHSEASATESKFDQSLQLLTGSQNDTCTHVHALSLSHTHIFNLLLITLIPSLVHRFYSPLYWTVIQGSSAQFKVLHVRMLVKALLPIF